MADDTSVTIVICAHTMDRWQDVSEAIESLHRQTRPPEQIILVIDHNETLLARATAAFTSGVTVVPNRYPRGLSGGRNTGIEVSTSTLVGFLDDDATAAPDWLEHLVFQCKESEVLGVTCRIEPHWLGTRPAWFPEEFLWTVGCSWRGQPTRVQTVRNVIGAAMLIKRAVLDVTGGFSDLFGRNDSGAFVSCDETELCLRAKMRFPAGRFVIVPHARIHHKVPASRLTWQYFRRRCLAEGRSKAYIRNMVQMPDALGTERDYVLRILTSGFLFGLRDAVLKRNASGLGRAAAIALGLSATTYGYLQVQFRRSIAPLAAKTAAQ